MSAALLLAACSEKDVPEEDPGQVVTFKVSAPLVVTRAITRSGTSLTDQISQIDYAVYNSTGDKTTTGQQLSTDANFGTVSVKLPSGTYKAVFTAKGANNTGTYNVLFGSGYQYSSIESYNQEFYYKLIDPLTVSNTNTTQSVELKRPVACIVFNITDEAPDDVSYVTESFSTKAIAMGLSGGVITGTDTKKSQNFTISDKKLAPIAIYLLPQTIASITITAYDKSGTALSSKSVTNLTIEANKRYTISGTMFEDTNKRGFTVTIDDNWAEDVNVPI